MSLAFSALFNNLLTINNSSLENGATNWVSRSRLLISALIASLAHIIYLKY